MKTEFEDIGFDVVDGVQLAQYRVQWLTLVSTAMDFWDPRKEGNSETK
jgi:hypothetical protein